MAERRGRVHSQALRTNPVEEGPGEIHVAARKGNMPKLRRLLEQQRSSVDAKTTDFSKTPLHYACQYGQLNAVRLLLDFEADIEAKTSMSRSPLHLACAQGHASVVEYLLDKGADLAAKTPDGQLPHDLALKYNYPDVVQVIRSKVPPSSKELANDLAKKLHVK